MRLQPIENTSVERTFKRPVGNRIAKEEHKQGKLHEFAIRAQAATTKDMVEATWRKIKFF